MTYISCKNQHGYGDFHCNSATTNDSTMQRGNLDNKGLQEEKKRLY